MFFFSFKLFYYRYVRSQYLKSYKFQEEKGCWLWKKPPPLSKKPTNIVDPIDGVKIKDVTPKEKKASFKIRDRLLKGIRSLVIISNLVYFFLDHCCKLNIVVNFLSKYIVTCGFICFCRVCLQYLSQRFSFPSYNTLCSQLLQSLP